MRVHEMIKRYYPQYYSIETYDAENVVRVHKLDEEWGVFSNFAHTPLTVAGKKYDTSERLYQVMKMATLDARDAVYNSLKGNPKMVAKRIAKESPELIRSDWGQIIVDVMKFCLQTKYEQSEEFRNALSLTKGKYIVEDQTSYPKKNADTWGVKLVDGKYVGPNLLGRLLMELRDNEGKLEYSLPSDILK